MLMNPGQHLIQINNILFLPDFALLKGKDGGFLES